MNDELLTNLKKYEGKWVALFGPDEELAIVASGDDAAEASEEARAKGYKEATLMKVLPSGAAYVPLLA